MLDITAEVGAIYSTSVSAEAESGPTKQYLLEFRKIARKITRKISQNREKKTEKRRKKKGVLSPLAIFRDSHWCL